MRSDSPVSYCGDDNPTGLAGRDSDPASYYRVDFGLDGVTPVSCRVCPGTTSVNGEVGLPVCGSDNLPVKTAGVSWGTDVVPQTSAWTASLHHHLLVWKHEVLA